MTRRPRWVFGHRGAWVAPCLDRAAPLRMLAMPVTRRAREMSASGSAQVRKLQQFVIAAMRPNPIRRS